MAGVLQPFHCGSELPEPAVFGLSAGLECAYFESPALDPGVAVFGRTASLELDLGRILSLRLRSTSALAARLAE